MSRFGSTYVKVSGMIYGLILLVGVMIWLYASYFCGIVPAVIYYGVGIGTFALIILGGLAVIILIQLIAWVICHVIAKVTSIRGL